MDTAQAEATLVMGTQRLTDGIKAAGGDTGILPPGTLAALLQMLLNLAALGGICPKPTPTPPTPTKDAATAVAETRAAVKTNPVITQFQLTEAVLSKGLASRRRDARTLAQGSMNALEASTDDELVKMVTVHNQVMAQVASMPE